MGSVKRYFKALIKLRELRIAIIFNYIIVNALIIQLPSQ